MATFRRFEEIQAWQKARVVTRMVYDATSQGDFARDYGLRDQLRRASVSVMANIAEGYGRRTDRDFAKFLDIAEGSLAEAQSHLYIAQDLGYMSAQQFDGIYAGLDEAGRMIHSLARHLRKERIGSSE
jgi:four helix bundle protein